MSSFVHRRSVTDLVNPNKTCITDNPNTVCDGSRWPWRNGCNYSFHQRYSTNGVEFSAPAPVNNILGAYTLAPFDDAGGHINVNQGYHYHAATGISTAVEQNDGHAPLIGYALDGHAIYAQADAEGNEATGLDECRGHSDSERGYHYHADAAGNNNFINCLYGAYAN